MTTYINRVKLQDYSDLSPDHHVGITDGFLLECLAGESMTTKTVNFPYSVAIVGGGIDSSNCVTGDYFSTYSAPVSPIGVLSQDALLGTNTLVSAPALPENTLFNGQCVTVGGDEYCILSYDYSTGTITLTQNLTNNYLATTPVYLRVYTSRNYYIKTGILIEFGLYFFGSHILPVGTDLVLKYQHSVVLASDKDIPFYLYYFYGVVD